MRQARRCLLVAGALIASAGVFADGPGGSKIAQARELWMKRQSGFLPQKTEIVELSKAYEAAKSPEEKQKIQFTIRKKIDDLYTLKERSRQETIQKLEKQLADLKQQLADLKQNDEKRRANRKAVIDGWTQQLTEGGP